MKTRGAGLLCSIASLLSACGTAASYDYDLPPWVEPPPLTQLRGQVVGIPDAPTEQIQVALVWLPVSPAEGKNQVSQPVTSHAARIYMDIDISEPPPIAAIERADMMSYAQAEVVLYQDRNSNSRLDVVGRGLASPDRILGRADGFRLWWLGAGSPAPPDARGYKPVAEGFSVTYGPVSIDPEPGDCAPDPQPGGNLHPRCTLKVKDKATDVAPLQPLTITVSNDPALQSYACLGFWGMSSEKSDEWPDDTPGWNSPDLRNQICNEATCTCKDAVCPLDLPVAGKTITSPVHCNEAKTAYVWKDCVRDPKFCGTLFCHYGHGERDADPSKPLPEGWPDCL
jgi:hypothetical protein